MDHMSDELNRDQIAATPESLADEDITSVRVDRRSFLSRAVAGGSITVGAVLATACPGGTDADQGTDSADAAPSGTDADQGAEAAAEGMEAQEGADSDSGGTK